MKDSDAHTETLDRQMLDLNYVREHLDEVRAKLQNVACLLGLDDLPKQRPSVAA